MDHRRGRHLPGRQGRRLRRLRPLRPLARRGLRQLPRYEDPDDDIDGSSWIVAGVNWADPDADDTEGTLTAIAECIDGPAAGGASYAERHAAALRYAEKLKARALATKHR